MTFLCRSNGQGVKNEANENEKLEFQSSMYDTQIVLQIADVYSSVIA